MKLVQNLHTTQQIGRGLLGPRRRPEGSSFFSFYHKGRGGRHSFSHVFDHNFHLGTSVPIKLNQKDVMLGWH